MALTDLAQMNHSELSHMAGDVDDRTINIVVVIIIIIIIRTLVCSCRTFPDLCLIHG